jgi:hypothetical protein
MYSSGSFVGWSCPNPHSYTYSFINRTTTVWNGMAMQNLGAYYDNTLKKFVFYSDATTDRVAILMAYIGSQVGMSYGEQSSASTENLVGLFYNEGINCNHADYNSSSITNNLKNSLPVIIRAHATQNNHTFLGLFHLYYTYDDGHAWIIDGYEGNRIKYTYTYQWYPDVMPFPPVLLPIFTKTEEEIITTPNYFSMNWGWDGNHDNGWYAIGNNAIWTINTTDGNNNPVTYQFQYNKKMIINFSVR